MKIEWNAKLGPGRHTVDLSRIRNEFVEPFNNLRRFNLFGALNSLVRNLERLSIRCELWIDGSFLTEKIEPDDIDLSIMIEAEDFDRLDEEAKEFLEQIEYSDEKYLGCLDSFLCIVYPKGDPRRKDDPPEDWARQWSLERNERYLKGFAVMRIAA